MAGGLGRRLRPLTEIIPKPLLPIGESSILEIIIKHLKNNGFNEIFIATNYKSHIFESYLGDGSKFGVKIYFSKEDKDLGTAAPIKLLKSNLNEPFLVINGDVITNLNFKKLIQDHKNNNAELTVVTKKIETPLRYGLVESDGNRLIDIKEKPSIYSEVLAGIYILNPELIDLIPDDYYNMPTLIKKIVNLNKKVLTHLIRNEYWLDIGIIEDYQKVNEDLKNGKIRF